MSARTYDFGGIALFLFGVQVVTGTLLALYYRPYPGSRVSTACWRSRAM